MSTKKSKRIKKGQLEEKRTLTRKEIDHILDFIQPNPFIPPESANYAVKIVKDDMRAQLKSELIYPSLIPKLKQQIEKQYYDSVISPGESVGVICGQSNGEKQTQMTLNSVDWNSKILYKKDTSYNHEEIGAFIDTLLEKHSEIIKNIPENRTEYLNLLDIEESAFYIPSCDEDGDCDWFRIEGVTRHLPVGKLVRIMTESGRTVSATQAKSFLVYDGTKFTEKLGSELSVGDVLPTTRNLPSGIIYEWKADIMYYIGKFLGILFMEGTTLSDVIFFKNKSEYKPIIKYILQNMNKHDDIDSYINSEFMKNYITRKINNDEYLVFNNKVIPTETGIDRFPSFMFDPENYNIHRGFISIIILGLSDIRSENVLLGLSFILSYYNIKVTHCGREGKYIKIIDSESIMDIISGQFEPVIPKRDVIFDKVTSIEYTSSSTEFVYDLTVEFTKNFQLFNGLNCRDTFHRAGQSEKEMTEGVPRFTELINATKNQKTVNCKIFMKEKPQNIREVRDIVGNNFVGFTLEKLTLSAELCKKDINNIPIWYDHFSKIYNLTIPFFSDNYICIKLDKNKLYEYKIHPSLIATKLEENVDGIYVMYSPTQLSELHVYIDDSELSLPSNGVGYITEENMVDVYVDEIVLPELMSVLVCGIGEISQIFYIKEGDEWIIETEGCNFREILAHPLVETEKTFSNNVWDIYEVLGIEAARYFLLQEYGSILEGINYCHTALLVDKSTFTGTITPFTRFSMRNDDAGPIRKASFEETKNNFSKAAVNGEIEYTRGVSASIICGKRANVGTGFLDVKMNASVFNNI